MPNWCKNLLKAPGESLKDVLTKEQEVSFELISPMPKELENTISPSKERNQELIDKYGSDNWYDWRWNNWGCKWDAKSTMIQEENDIIEFETPWGPPIAWLQTLSRRYPGKKFRIQFADEFLGQEPLGEVIIVNGEITQEKVARKGQSNAEQASDEIWCGIWTENLVNANREKTNENQN